MANTAKANITERGGIFHYVCLEGGDYVGITTCTVHVRCRSIRKNKADASAASVSGDAVNLVRAAALKKLKALRIE